MLDVLQAVLLALSMAAGAAPAEKRMQYLFIPNQQALRQGVQPMRFTAVVHDRDMVLIAAVRDGRWLRYSAERGSCVTHEQFALFRPGEAPVFLEADSPLSGCSPSAAQKTPAVDPELAVMFRGPIAQIAPLNPFAKLLCSRAARFGCTASATTPYVAQQVTVDCGFDATHGVPCRH